MSYVVSNLKTAKYRLREYLSKIYYLSDKEDKELSYKLEEFIVYCRLAIDICTLLENRSSDRELAVMQECIQSPNHAKNIDYLLRLTRAKNLQISLYLTNANAIIKDIKILLRYKKSTGKH